MFVLGRLASSRFYFPPESQDVSGFLIGLLTLALRLSGQNHIEPQAVLGRQGLQPGDPAALLGLQQGLADRLEQGLAAALRPAERDGWRRIWRPRSGCAPACPGSRPRPARGMRCADPARNRHRRHRGRRGACWRRIPRNGASCILRCHSRPERSEGEGNPSPDAPVMDPLPGRFAAAGDDNERITAPARSGTATDRRCRCPPGRSRDGR